VPGNDNIRVVNVDSGRLVSLSAKQLLFFGLFLFWNRGIVVYEGMLPTIYSLEFLALLFVRCRSALRAIMEIALDHWLT
jgi:hypothetical protein